MSFRCGTLVKVKVSRVSKAAQSNGNAAFLAPEMAISPESARPPVISNLSICAPLGRGKRLHRERVQFTAIKT